MNPKKLTITIELITPQMACEMLKKQRNVRSLKRRDVVRYVKQLQRCWKLNGETIKFDRDGYLIDGHHRLTACAESGIAFETVVVRGLDNSDFVDDGVPRTAGSMLSGRGTKNSELAAAVCRTLFLLSQKRDPWRFSEKIPYSELLEFWDKSIDQETAEQANSIGRSCKLLVGSVVSSFAYQAILLNGVEPVADFIQGIESGANLSPGTPRYELRRWMEARRSKNLNPYLLRRMLYVALVRAWKMEKEGVLQIKGQSLWSKIQITDLPEID